MSFLIASIVASFALTILVNVGLRVLSRGSRRRGARRVGPGPGSSMPWLNGRTGTATRVFFPWKLMLAVSVIATIAINVVR